MKRILASGLAAVLLLSACSTEKGVEISEAWARPAAQGENGAIYFVIRNPGREADELMGVSSDIAEAVEMHASQMDGEVMQMHQLHSVILDPGAEVAFEPGGLHIMLIGLKNDLKTGDELEITLQFKNSGYIDLLVSVQEGPEGR